MTIPDSGPREIAAVAGVAVAAVGLALLVHGHHPAAEQLGGTFAMLGWSHVDWNVHQWNLWEFRRFYLGEPVLFHCSAEFFPQGLATLAIQGDPLLKLAGGLLALVLPAGATFTVVGLGVLVGNALGGYVLGRTLTASRAAGALLAMLLCFNGAVAWSVNTGNLENGLWLWQCLYLAWLWRTLRTGSWRDAAPAAVFCLLAALTNLTVVHQLALFSGVLVLARVRRLTWPRVKALSLMVAVIAAGLLPLALLMGSGGQQQRQQYAVPLFIEQDVSALGDLALPMLNSYPPGRYLPWNRVGPGDDVEPHRHDQEDADTTYALLTLILLALVVTPRRSAPWLVAGALFGALALGPVLIHVGTDGARVIPMPFQAAHAWLPLYDRIHFPHRIVNFAHLAFGVAAALGVARVGRLVGGRRGGMIVAVILALTGSELLASWPLRTVARTAVHPYYEQLGESPDGLAAIAFPLDYGIADSRHLVEQASHGRPLFNGCVPRYFGEDAIPNLSLLRNNPILARAYQLQQPHLHERVRQTLIQVEDRHGTLYPADVARAREQLAEHGFGYLFLRQQVTWEPAHRMVLPPDSGLRAFLGSTLGPPLYEDDELVVFTLAGPEPAP